MSVERNHEIAVLTGEALSLCQRIASAERSRDGLAEILSADQMALLDEATDRDRARLAEIDAVVSPAGQTLRWKYAV